MDTLTDTHLDVHLETLLDPFEGEPPLGADPHHLFIGPEGQSPLAMEQVVGDGP